MPRDLIGKRLKELLQVKVIDDEVLELCNKEFKIKAPTQYDAICCALIRDAIHGNSNSLKLLIGLIGELPEQQHKEKELDLKEREFEHKKVVAERGY